MTPKRKLLYALAAIGAAIAALPVILSSPPAGQRALVEFAARVPCQGAKRFARDAGEFDCRPGERVPALLQVVIDLQDDGGVDVEAVRDLAGDLDIIPASIRFPPMARAVRPGKALTTLEPYAQDCIVGEWRTDAGTVWDNRFETSWCCGSGCYCAGSCRFALPTYIAGDENAATRKLLCRALPGHAACDGGAL